MQDVSSSDIQSLVSALNTLNGSIVKSSPSKPPASGKSNTPAARPQNNEQEERKYSAAKKMATKSFDLLSNSASSVSRKLAEHDKGLAVFNKNMANVSSTMMSSIKSYGLVIGVFGGIAAAGGALIGTMMDNVATYRKMTDAGQNFGGSMLNMSIAAAHSRLSLDEFANMVTKNSKVISIMGVKSFSELGLKVRDNLSNFGMLNMSVEQVNDYLAEYTETQRLYGNVSNLNNERAAKSIASLANETTLMAQYTGKNRMELMKTQQTAVRDENIRLLMMRKTGTDLANFQDSLNKATVFTAALPGEAGDTLTRMLSQTVGRGSSLLSDDLKTFSSLGIGGVATVMDEFAGKVKTGNLTNDDVIKFQRDFVAQIEQNIGGLEAQASYGNAEAKRALQVYTEMKALDSVKLKNMMAENDKAKAGAGKADNITSIAMTFEKTIKDVTGFIRENFLVAFQKAVGPLGDFEKSGVLARIKESFTKLGTTFGTVLGNFVANGGIENIGTAIGTLVGAIPSVINAFTSVVSVIGSIGTVFTWLREHIVGFGTGLGVLAASLTVLKVKDKLMGLMGMNSRIEDFADKSTKALRVTVVGGSLGGRGNQSDVDRGSKGGKTSQPKLPGKKPGMMGKMWNAGKGLWGKVPKRLGAGALLSFAGEKALEASPDFKGKSLAQGGLGVAGAAATGAMLGSFVPGVGNLVGGGLGALYGMWSERENLMKGASELFSSPTPPTVSPVPALNPAKPLATVTSKTETVPRVNSDALADQVKLLEANQKRIMAENSDLRNMLTQLVDQMKQANAINVAGYTDLVDQTKKGNAIAKKNGSDTF